MSFFADKLLCIFNRCIKKYDYSFYFTTGISCKNNCEDFYNYDGNNTLTCLSSLLNYSYDRNVRITVEYPDDERRTLYDKLVGQVKNQNIDLYFTYQPYVYSNRFERIKFYIKKYHQLFKHKFWIIGTGDHHLHGKLKSQRIINTNYFVTCKNDYLPNDPRRWSFIDDFITCSMLHSMASSAQTGVLLGNCRELGFPRNDCLFEKRHENEIRSWIKNKIGFNPTRIIVYAPTYRDYEKNEQSKERFLFGYDIPKLEKWLEENKTALVCKLHNLQARRILKYPKGVIAFEPTYDFTFYELLAISDCLITDYSSVGYDYMLTDRPLIYNLYDYDYYVQTRGVSYDPYDRFCPGVIVKNSNEMMDALNDVINGIDVCKEKRRNLISLFHKYPDNNSSERVAKYLIELAGLQTD